MFVLTPPLHPDRGTRRLGEERRVGRAVVRAVVAVTARRFLVDDADGRRCEPEQYGDGPLQRGDILRARPDGGLDAGALVRSPADVGERGGRAHRAVHVERGEVLGGEYGAGVGLPEQLLDAVVLFDHRRVMVRGVAQGGGQVGLRDHVGARGPAHRDAGVLVGRPGRGPLGGRDHTDEPVLPDHVHEALDRSGTGEFADHRGVRVAARRTYDPAVQHAGQRDVGDVAEGGVELAGEVDAWLAGADDGVVGGRDERHGRVQRQHGVAGREELGVGDRASAGPEAAVVRDQCVRLDAQCEGRAVPELGEGGGGCLAQLDAAVLDGLGTGGAALADTEQCVALHVTHVGHTEP